MYSSPTRIRCIRQYDSEKEFVKPYDLSSLTNVCLAGERFDAITFNWLKKCVPKALINDNYW